MTGRPSWATTGCHSASDAVKPMNQPGLYSRGVTAVPAAPRRKILYVAYYFPPFAGSGAWSPLAAVNALAKRGHDVTVLAADQWTYGLAGQAFDPALAPMIDPSVKVYRWPFPLGSHDPVITRWDKERVAAFSGPPTKRTRWEQTTKRNWSQVFPEPSAAAAFGRGYAPLTAAARHLHRINLFDLVITTASPWMDFAVPLQLGAETGVPTVIYDRDAWLFDVFTGEPSLNAALIEPLLAQLLSQATRAWFVSEPIAEAHRQRFPEHAAKIVAVLNGWDPEFLPADIAPPVREQGKGLVFRFVGARQARFPLETLLDGWKRARQIDEVVARSELQFVGPNQAAVTGPGFAKLGITCRDNLPRVDLADVYRQTDALVFLKEGVGMGPSGKIFEYAATGLPIVAALHPDHSARQILSGRDLVFYAQGVEPDAIAKALVAAARHQPTAGQVAQAHQHAEQYRRDRSLEVAFEDLEEALGWK